jgi:hypothetical protein
VPEVFTTLVNTLGWLLLRDTLRSCKFKTGFLQGVIKMSLVNRLKSKFQKFGIEFGIITGIAACLPSLAQATCYTSADPNCYTVIFEQGTTIYISSQTRPNAPFLCSYRTIQDVFYQTGPDSYIDSQGFLLTKSQDSMIIFAPQVRKPWAIISRAQCP